MGILDPCWLSEVIILKMFETHFPTSSILGTLLYEDGFCTDFRQGEAMFVGNPLSSIL